MNPEQPGALSRKAQKYLTTGQITKITVEYGAGSVSVTATLPAVGNNAPRVMPFALAVAQLTPAAPAAEPGLSKATIISRFESRLDMDAPSAFHSAASDDAARTLLSGMPFRIRGAISASNSAFPDRYPGGFVCGLPTDPQSPQRAGFLSSWKDECRLRFATDVGRWALVAQANNRVPPPPAGTANTPIPDGKVGAFPQGDDWAAAAAIYFL